MGETMNQPDPFIRLHAKDDVVIARQQLFGGTSIEGVSVRGLIPGGHKVAIRDLKPVILYVAIARLSDSSLNRFKPANMCMFITALSVTKRVASSAIMHSAARYWWRLKKSKPLSWATAEVTIR